MTIILSISFLIGYLLIVFEEKIKHDKSAIALTTGGLLWILLSILSNHEVNHDLYHHIQEIAGIIFFLMGAMTIVELIDLNGGFNVIIEKLNIRSKKKLIITFAFTTFFMSAILDNLTTAIVMSNISRKILKDKTERLFLAAIIIIAANSGGAWSPLGDITTTMLWISNRISAFKVIEYLLFPSIVSLVIPLSILLRNFKGETEHFELKQEFSLFHRNLMFFAGVLLLISVPIIKILTNLPPYLAMLFALGVYWIISDIIANSKEPDQKESTSIYRALERLDMPSLLFFLGILLAVSALQTAGILLHIAQIADQYLPSYQIFATIIGLVSSIFDNVPILGAIQGMYNTDTYAIDHPFWHLLAFCVGSGGSMLVIGSAAGVAIMNSEGIKFGWYLKKITFPALLGFISSVMMIVIIFKYLNLPQ